VSTKYELTKSSEPNTKKEFERSWCI